MATVDDAYGSRGVSNHAVNRRTHNRVISARAMPASVAAFRSTAEFHETVGEGLSLGDLERHLVGVTHDLGPDLDQIVPQRRQRPMPNLCRQHVAVCLSIPSNLGTSQEPLGRVSVRPGHTVS